MAAEFRPQRSRSRLGSRMPENVRLTLGAATCALRGADAVYVATARHAGASLLTLDAEVRDRASGVVVVRTPDEWLGDAM